MGRMNAGTERVITEISGSDGYCASAVLDGSNHSAMQSEHPSRCNSQTLKVLPV
jgi:hypothetical protein